MSGGKCLRCVRSNLLYNGIGGSKAMGAGLKPFAATVVAIKSRGITLIVDLVVSCMFNK